MSFKYFNVKNGLTTGNIALHSANANVQANYFLGNISVTSSANLGNVGNLRITGGTEGYVLQTDGTGNLSWVSQGGGGSASISNVSSNVNIPFANGNVNTSVGGIANVFVVTNLGANISGTANVTGNLTAGNITAGTGTGGNITGGNVISANTFIASGNISAGNANLGNLVTANFFTGTLTTNAQPNITSVGTLTSLTATGNVTGGNLVTAGKVYASEMLNGGTGIYLSAGPAGYINFFTTGGDKASISDTGNIIASNLIANSTVFATTANISANVTAGNANLGNLVTANYLTGTLTTASQPNITSVGTLSNLSVTGNANVGNLGTTNLVATGTGSFSGNVNMNSYNIVSLATPVSDTDAATKGYVDSVAQGLDPKASVIYASTTSLFGSGYTYNNGSSGVGATLTSSSNGALSIDGNTPSVGNRVLLKNEVGAYVNTTTESAAFNGIYVVTQVGSVSLPFILTRSTDFDTGTEIPGAFTFVEAGSTLADTGWVCTTNAPITVGTTQIIWAQFSSAGTYSAGTGLTLTGSVFSISNTSVTSGSYGSGDSVATFTVNGQGQLTAASNTSITANAANLTGTTLNASVVTSSLTSLGSLTGLTVSNASGLVNFTNTANVSLGAVANVHITGGSSSQYLQTDGTGNLSWVSISAGSGISNGTSNISIPAINGNINLTAGGNTSLVVTDLGANISGNVEATGNITAQYFTGNGYYLTGVDTSPANIANGISNVQVYFDGNVTTSVAGNANVLNVTGTGIVVTGNATIGTGVGGNLIGANVLDANLVNAITVNASANVNAQYFVGNGFYLTGVDTSPSNITNGSSNVEVIFNGNVTTSVAGNAGILTVTGTGIVVSGNATIGSGTGGNIIGANIISANTFNGALANGNSDINIPAANGNINFSAVGNANVMIVTGTGINIAGTLNATGNANVGNIGAIGVIATTLGGNLTTNAQPNITSIGSLTGLTVSNATGVVDFTTTANVTLGAVANLHISGGTNGYVLSTDGSGTLSWVAQGSGSISNISNGNSNVNIPSANGNVNITAVGNTSLIVTGTGANVFGTLNVTSNLTAINANLGNLTTSNYFAGVLTTNAQPNITSVGSLTGLTVSNATGVVDFTTTANVTLGAVANLHISGGTSSQYLQTDGAGNLSWSTVTAGAASNIANGNSNVNIPSANGNVNISAVGNANVLVVTGTGVNVVGTLNTTGNISFTGANVSLGNLGNVRITGGTANYVLSTDGAGNLDWVAQSGGNAANVTVDNFTGNGVQTIFTLSTTPIGINQTSVNYNGATVLRTDYTLANANITFSSAPANGSYIEVTTINLTSGGGGGGITAQDLLSPFLLMGA